MFDIFKKKVREVNGPMSPKEFDTLVKDRMHITNDELINGYKVMKKYPHSVSILGSARFKSDNKYYQHAESLAGRIVRELDYTIVTGGGPGIMEAGNKGAFEAGGKSIGFGIKLPFEQDLNKYITESVNFEYFSTRKTLLFFATEVYVYYPGGFGTMDELFEVLTLMQTGEISKAPVILVGKEFWEPLLGFIDTTLLTKNQTINEDDTSLYKIVDDENEIMEIIKNAPLRQD